MIMTALAPRTNPAPTEQMRWLHPLAAAVVLHGLIHLVGTVRKFAEASDGETAHYLGGLWDITDATTLRVIGVIWAVTAVVVVASAIPIWRNDSGWPTTLFVVAAASLALTVVGLWTSVLGLAVNVGLLVVAFRAATNPAVGLPEPNEERSMT